MKTPEPNIRVIIEKTNTGFSAYATDYPVYTTGSTVPELMENVVEAASLFFEDEGGEIKAADINYEIDFEQLFAFYKILNTEYLAQKIQMDPAMLARFVKGKAKPTAAQSQKILLGIHELGEELSDIKHLLNPAC